MNLDYKFYTLIKQTSLLLDECERQLLAQFDLSVSRFNLLQIIYENPGIGTIGLSEELLCHPSNISRLVRGTENEGLIKRTRNQHDYRAIHLELTTKGKALFLSARDAHGTYVKQRMQLFNQTEKQAIIDYLQPLYRSLRYDSLNNVSKRITNGIQ